MDTRILVIANATSSCPPLLDEIAQRARHGAVTVLVVAPALNTRLRHLLSDTDGAIAAASARLGAATLALRERGVDAWGEIGDADPMRAIEDALAGFEPDEMYIATHPPGRSHWLEHGLIERARDRFALPITHLIPEHGGSLAHA